MSNTSQLQVPSGLSGVASRFFTCKGQFLSAEFISDVKPSKAFKGKKLTKHTKGVFRAGINYANLKPVLEGIADGTRGEVGSLPWGRWEHFPYTILHTPKNETEEQRYIRLYPTDNCEITYTFMVDGIQVQEDTFKKYLTASDAEKLTKQSMVICPKESNIIKIGE
jgi:hypothetical protein